MKIIIHNGRVIYRDKILKKGCVYIENGIISDVCAVPPRVKEGLLIDAENGYVMPGFIDLHVHGVGICDLYRDPAAGLANMSRILAGHGVTSFLPALITAPLPIILNTLRALRRRVQLKGAVIQGVNMEGPFINPEKCGAHPAKHIRKPDIKDLEKIIKSAGGMLRIMTVAPEMPGALNFIKPLTDNSVIPAMGHTMADFEQTMRAIDAGFRYVSHTFNAMTSFHHRLPGAPAAVFTRNEVTAEIIADGVHVHPAVIKLLCEVKGIKRIILVTDSLTGIMRRRDRARFAGDEVENDGVAVYNKKGILMGSALPMNKALQNIIRFTGAELTDAVKLVTINPAEVLGVRKRKGRIEKGMDADIVILDTDFNVKTCITGGKVV